MRVVLGCRRRSKLVNVYKKQLDDKRTYTCTAECLQLRVYVYRPVASAAFFSFFFLLLPVPFIITMPTIWLALFQRASVCVNFLSSDHFYPFAPKIFTQQEILSPKEM